MLLSYFGAFALVIVVFAVAVRLSFESILQHQVAARLETLARAGMASVEFSADGFTVNARTLGGFAVRLDTEGVQWFDAAGRLTASRGQVPLRQLSPSIGQAQIPTKSGALETVTLPIRDASGRLRGYVRAGETIDEVREGRPALDRGLVVGSIVAIVAATLGGFVLARAALQQREASFERLRQFTADVSHELRTPLAALTTTAGLALREAPDMPELAHRRLTTIVAVTDQMRRILDDLLILARAGKSLEREMFVVRVDALLARVHEAQIAFAAQRAIALSSSAYGPLDIYGNPDQLERIVTNLVQNALHYTEPGGTVDVSCTSDHSAVRIAVRDTGIGIPSEFRERIFDRFWRGDDTRGSSDGRSGLGLAIARALARRHGGDILVASEPGRGSTFTLTLPRRPPPV